MRRYQNTHTQILVVTEDVKKTSFSQLYFTVKEVLSNNQRRCEMKSYDELKADMEAIQQ